MIKLLINNDGYTEENIIVNERIVMSTSNMLGRSILIGDIRLKAINKSVWNEFYNAVYDNIYYNKSFTIIVEDNCIIEVKEGIT